MSLAQKIMAHMEQPSSYLSRVHLLSSGVRTCILLSIYGQGLSNMALWEGHDNDFKILHHCTQSCLYTTHAYVDDCHFFILLFHIHVPISGRQLLPSPNFKY